MCGVFAIHKIIPINFNSSVFQFLEWLVFDFDWKIYIIHKFYSWKWSRLFRVLRRNAKILIYGSQWPLIKIRSYLLILSAALALACSSFVWSFVFFFIRLSSFTFSSCCFSLTDLKLIIQCEREKEREERGREKVREREKKSVCKREREREYPCTSAICRRQWSVTNKLL